jgi:tetratricopeptide (TPR) repeat protein
MADRYTYLPLIGPFIMLTWGLPEIIPPDWSLRPQVLRVCAVATILMLSAVTSVQLGYWRNGIVLFEHALSVTSRNAAAHNSLGTEYGKQGRYREASEQFIAALEINADNVQTLRNLGLAYVAMDQIDNAIAAFREALRLRPDDTLSLSFLAHYMAVQSERSDDKNRYPETKDTLQK